jgi:hypothetical protein
MIFLAKDLRTKPAEVAHLRALYDGEVLHADRQFGAFLDFLKSQGLYERSMIVLVSTTARSSTSTEASITDARSTKSFSACRSSSSSRAIGGRATASPSA